MGPTDVMAVLIVAVAAVVMYITYCVNRPNPQRDEAERADRRTRDDLAYAENEKKRAFSMEMAKLGYVQKSVLKSEEIDEGQDEYGDNKNIQREWQLAWVKDDAKVAETSSP